MRRKDKYELGENVYRYYLVAGNRSYFLVFCNMVGIVLQAIRDGEVCTTTENIKGALRYQEIVLKPSFAKLLEAEALEDVWNRRTDKQ